MRKTHDDFIQRWVEFMQQHPDDWKIVHTRFINAQFEKHTSFLQKLLKEPRGKETLIALYNIQNLKGYQKLLEERSFQ